MAWGLRTDQDDARREDLMDIIGKKLPMIGVGFTYCE